MTVETPVPLHTEEHAANPEGSYEALRRQGPVGLAELAPGVVVLLVTDYEVALQVLRDERNWTKDTRPWAHKAPRDSKVAQAITPRPNLTFTDGETHAHLRKVVVESLKLLDPHDVRTMTFRYADQLLAEFSDTGSADLVKQYARQLPLMVFNALFGMPDEYGPQLVEAIASMLATDPDVINRGEESMGTYLGTLYATKKAQRGHDLTSWFIDHPNGLGEAEVVEQVQLVFGAGNQPTVDLMANSFEHMLTDGRYFGTLTTGSLPIQHAMSETLWSYAPIANYGVRSATGAIDEFHGLKIKAGDPLAISYAAANTCPYVGKPDDGSRSGVKGHLSFGAGPHTCPASDLALLIAEAGIERLLSYLPDIRLAVPADKLTRYPGAIWSSLTALPVQFTPLKRDAEGATPWSRGASSHVGADVPRP